MARITVSALKTGMTLAAPVTDRNGRMLLGEGVELTEQHLRVLKIWGISSVEVEAEEGGEDDAASSISPEILAEAEAWVTERFRYNDLAFDPVAELFGFCVQRKAREFARELSANGATDCASAPADAQAAEELPEIDESRRVDPYELASDDMKLGSLPMVFHKLVEVVNDSRSSSTDVAEVISHDTDLSARLLRVVNSSFYGLRSKIDTISRAVAVIGSNQLVSLAMGFSIVTFFKGIPSSLINMRSFWAHSIACGIAARMLASHHNLPNTERFFVNGLLHDIGRLALFKLVPEQACSALEYARASNDYVYKAEKKVLGFSHQKLGGILLKKWKCPVSLENAVRWHHNPTRSATPVDAAVMLLADALVNALELGTSGERYVERITPELWNEVALPEGALVQTATQVEMQLDEIIQFFEIDG